jgi:2-methylfumaryl-CoA isomerase
VTPDGHSIYWAGLNKGKRSMEVDMGSAEGQQLVQRLIATAGVLITNVAGRQWHSYETLTGLRPDLIHLEVVGRADGATGVDYTVNAATGFPLVTGPVDHVGPVNHVMPSWDVGCGLYAALAILAALRYRDASGRGSRIRLPLDDVALATAANLGFLTEAMVNGDQRPRLGNAIYGQYGNDFTTNDGATFMVVALTVRHFRDLAELTGTTGAVAALADALGADFSDEGQRYEHREVLNELFAEWFTAHTAAEVCVALSSSSVLWERYQSFHEVANSPRVTENPLFAPLQQDRIGEHLAPGLPMSVDGAHTLAAPAPALGQDTVAVPAEWLGE